MRTKNYKAELEKLSDDYQDARDFEFTEQLTQFLSEYIYFPTTNVVELKEITEDDLTGFIDSFDFPEEWDWCMSEYESRLDTFQDAKYEEMKDERMERETD